MMIIAEQRPVAASGVFERLLDQRFHSIFGADQSKECSYPI
jgi:hypothetical protein